MNSMEVLKMKNKLFIFRKEIEENGENEELKKKIDDALLAMKELNCCMLFLEIENGEW